MTVIGFVGTPGSGKSYDAVKKVLDNLKLGRKVYTNIEGLDNPICREFIKAYTGLDDYQLATLLISKTDQEIEGTYTVNSHKEEVVVVAGFWSYVEKGSIIVLDEVHKRFSNREWSSLKNKLFCDWLSTHRHDGHDVVLITQDIEKVDKHARSLIEWCFYYRKINFLGSLVNNRYLRYTYSGDDHNGQPICKTQLPYDKKVFSCYKSYSSEEVKEVGFVKNVNILKHPVFYAIPVALCAVLYFGNQSSIKTGDVFGTNKAQATAMEKIKLSNKKSSGFVTPTNTVAAAATPVTATCTSYRALMPNGETILSRGDLPPGASLQKCFKAKQPES